MAIAPPMAIASEASAGRKGRARLSTQSSGTDTGTLVAHLGRGGRSAAAHPLAF